MMGDLISREALLAEIRLAIEDSGCVNHEREIMDCIRYAPAAHVCNSDEIDALRAENDMLKDTMIRACVWLDVHGRPGIPDVTRALSEAVASTVKKEAHNEP